MDAHNNIARIIWSEQEGKVVWSEPCQVITAKGQASENCLQPFGDLLAPQVHPVRQGPLAVLRSRRVTKGKTRNLSLRI